MSDCYEDINEAEVCDECDDSYPDCGENPLTCMITRALDYEENRKEAYE